VTDVAYNARIQAIYREVNEGIALINAEWDVPALEVLCECGTPGCTERIELTHAEYERLRANPTAFVLVPGHEDDAVEHVVRSGDGYVVVANHGRAATIAEQTDPRAAAR